MKFPEKYRVTDPKSRLASRRGDPYGLFLVPPDGGGTGRRQLQIIASDGVLESDGGARLDSGWEHVSVTANHGADCPTWDEMCFAKDLFWSEEECAVQFHPAKKDYVNTHRNVLHLWRFNGAAFPMPPRFMV